MRRATWFRILVPAAALTATIAVAEIAFRTLLFSGYPFMRVFRNADFYANQLLDDEYWLLYHFVDGRYPPPSRPHPILGWIREFDRETLLHDDTPHVGDRRPVLLYGDSFAACKSAPCFEDILNPDPSFAGSCFMLNYGVGGYGVDQSHLLMSRTVSKYRNPVVIFSLLTEDVDRNVLTVRVGRKPRFRLENGRLVLTGVPIEGDIDAFFEQSRPPVFSYLLRVARTVLYRAVLPRSISGALQDEPRKRREKIELTAAILREAIAELRRTDVEFLFVVFVGNWQTETSVVEDDDWRLDAILAVLDQEGVRYLNAKTILRRDMRKTGRPVADYFLADGHYNEYANRVVAAELKGVLPMCRP
jgi:hypothetical protein